MRGSRPQPFLLQQPDFVLLLPLCAGLGGLRASRGVLFMFRRDRMASDGTGLGCSAFAVGAFALCRRSGVTYVATPAGKGLDSVV